MHRSKRLPAPFLLLLFSACCFSQTVTTLPVKVLDGPNGMAIDKEGRLYVANEPGKKVLRIINDSAAEEVLACDSPDGLAFDGRGNLYISNFFSGVILRKKHGSIDTFAKGLHEPADIKWDGKAGFFVSEYERGSIKRIDTNGRITDFASGFKLPFGLAVDSDRAVYVAENSTGTIKKITPGGNVSFFAQIPGSITYLACSQKSGNLYVTCLSGHSLYSVTKNGHTRLLAGNGQGDVDGTLQEARFDQPNSVALSADGDLYISEFYLNRIRKISKMEK